MHEFVGQRMKLTRQQENPPPQRHAARRENWQPQTFPKAHQPTRNRQWNFVNFQPVHVLRSIYPERFRKSNELWRQRFSLIQNPPFLFRRPTRERWRQTLRERRGQPMGNGFQCRNIAGFSNDAMKQI